MTNRPEPIVEQIEEVLPSDYESSVFKLKKNLQSVLGPDVHIHLAASPALSPSRLPMLLAGRPRYRPVRWSELTETQRKKIQDFIVYVGTDDFVRYADTVVVSCPQAEWDAEIKRQAQVAAAAERGVVSQFRQNVSGSGVQISTSWEDMKGATSPRKKE